MAGLEESSLNRKLFLLLIDYQKKGIKYVICTDISKDGMLEGPSFELYKNIIETQDKSYKNHSFRRRIRT